MVHYFFWNCGNSQIALRGNQVPRSETIIGQASVLFELSTCTDWSINTDAILDT